MTADRIGHWRTARLAAFQREGYADYVGLARPLDLSAARAAMARDDSEMSPVRSGLYRRYELFVAYLLDRQRLSVNDLLAQPLDTRTVEQRILTASDL